MRHFAEALEGAWRRNQHPGFGSGSAVGDLAEGKLCIERRGGGSRLEDAEVRHRPFGAVLGKEQNPIARLHADGGESVRGRILRVPRQRGVDKVERLVGTV